MGLLASTVSKIIIIIYKMFLSEDELKDSCVLVMANKQDLPNAMSTDEVTEKLELNKLPPTQTWHKCVNLT